jgi:GTP1/Obg family GTP-binding protein
MTLRAACGYPNIGKISVKNLITEKEVDTEEGDQDSYAVSTAERQGEKNIEYLCVTRPTT